jgi:hypothetical protein
MDSMVVAQADALLENRRCIVAYLDSYVINGLSSLCSPLEGTKRLESIMHDPCILFIILPNIEVQMKPKVLHDRATVDTASILSQ